MTVRLPPVEHHQHLAQPATITIITAVEVAAS
jgi:hypothetical protein